MLQVLARWTVARYFARAGLRLDGSRPFDIKVSDGRMDEFCWCLFVAKLCHKHTLAFGEMHMAGIWTCERLAEMFVAVLGSRPRRSRPLERLVRRMVNLITNPQSVERARKAIEAHYDFGVRLYQRRLGSFLLYSCGFWWNARTLEEAQCAKMDHVLRKAKTRPGHALLDIGCGFGEVIKRAAQIYQVRAWGITLSRDQLVLARQICEGYDATPEHCDWRHVAGKYDRIISIGMFEHVGPRNYDAFFRKLARLLRPGGIVVLHTIVGNGDPDAFYQKYIFPEGVLPRVGQIRRIASRHLRILDEEHIYGEYALTLAAWRANDTCHWPELQMADPEKFTDEAYCMNQYYLASAEALDRIGRIHIAQFVFALPDFAEPYGIVRAKLR